VLAVISLERLNNLFKAIKLVCVRRERKEMHSNLAGFQCPFLLHHKSYGFFVLEKKIVSSETPHAKIWS
jgi:hypothetical protein